MILLIIVIFCLNRRHIQEYIVRNPDTKAYGISNCGLENEIIAFNKDELDKLSGYMSVLIVK